MTQQQTTQQQTAQAAQPRPNLGEAVALARVTLKGILSDVLADAGAAHDDWFALNMLAVRGGALPLEAMRTEMAAMLETDPSYTAALIERLAGRGLVEVAPPAATPDAPGDAEVRPTPAGEASLARWRESLGRLTADLLAPFDPADLATTERTLRAVTARAQTMRSR